MTKLSRFLFLALAGILATTAACDDAIATDAEFASITEEQAKLAIDAGWRGATLEAVFVFALASADPEGECPRVEIDGDRTTLIGNGCVREGTTINGSAVGINAPSFSGIFDDEGQDEGQNEDEEISGDVRYDFRGFSFTDEEGTLGLDGKVKISVSANEDEVEIASKIVVTLNDEELAFDHLSRCTNTACTQSGTIDMASLGGFAVIGSVEESGGDLRLEGLDVLTVELVEDQCVPYQVNGTNAGTYCPDGADEEPANLTATVRRALLGSPSLRRR